MAGAEGRVGPRLGPGAGGGADGDAGGGLTSDGGTGPVEVGEETLVLLQRLLLWPDAKVFPVIDLAKKLALSPSTTNNTAAVLRLFILLLLLLVPVTLLCRVDAVGHRGFCVMTCASSGCHGTYGMWVE
eukprot:COSAG05_NODE_5460_length_1168_cov_1.087933_1_plen_129_part_00